MRPLGLVDLGAANPRRPVDWGWRRAGRLLELGLRWSRRDGRPQVRRAKLSGRPASLRRSEADRRRLERKMPDVAGSAVAIVEGELDDARPRRGRGRFLLPSRSSPSPARRLHAGRSPRSRQAFFNVSDRMESKGYLIHFPGVRLKATPREPDPGLPGGCSACSRRSSPTADRRRLRAARPAGGRAGPGRAAWLKVAVALAAADRRDDGPVLLRALSGLRAAELAAEGACWPPRMSFPHPHHARRPALDPAEWPVVGRRHRRGRRPARGRFGRC